MVKTVTIDASEVTMIRRQTNIIRIINITIITFVVVVTHLLFYVTAAPILQFPVCFQAAGRLRFNNLSLL